MHYATLTPRAAQRGWAPITHNGNCLFFFFNLFIWLHWVPVAACGLSLVAASGGYSSLCCAGFSLRRLPPLQCTGSRWTGSVVARGLQRAGSAAVAHRPSHSAACGILPDQGSNPCPLHWQVDSQTLCHQGSPFFFFFLMLASDARRFFFWPHGTACGILAPLPGIKPAPPAVEARSLNHWTTREVQWQLSW